MCTCFQSRTSRSRNSGGGQCSIHTLTLVGPAFQSLQEPIRRAIRRDHAQKLRNNDFESLRIYRFIHASDDSKPRAESVYKLPSSDYDSIYLDKSIQLLDIPIFPGANTTLLYESFPFLVKYVAQTLCFNSVGFFLFILLFPFVVTAVKRGFREVNL